MLSSYERAMARRAAREVAQSRVKRATGPGYMTGFAPSKAQQPKVADPAQAWMNNHLHNCEVQRHKIERVHNKGDK